MPTADSLDYLARKAAQASANSGLNYQNIRDAQGSAQQQAVQNAYNGVADVNIPKTGYVGTPPANEGTSQPPPIVGNPYTLEGDPVYQAAIQAGQSQFNTARANALASKTTNEMQLANERKNLDLNSTEARRRTAGNYAARGMAGGATGALTLAEIQANAKQITAQTDIKDQISALNANYLENYGNANQTDAAGNKNFDWTGTLVGQNYKTQAAQNALTAQLARMGIQ
jgi:hypothetical protein